MSANIDSVVPLPGSGDAKAFRRAQWRILLLVMLFTLFLYTGRQNFGFAAHGMQVELGLSATALGVLNAALLVGYGLGQTINGNLGDLYGARRMVAIGAVLSVGFNWLVSLAHSFTPALIFWGLNGLAQSTSWPAINRVLANWWPRKERGKAIGMYLLACGLSGTMTYLLCIMVVHNLDWRWVFRLPVLLMLPVAGIYFIFARNRPEEEGFPPLQEETHEGAIAAVQESSRERYWQALKNRPFQLACLSIGCENCARYGLIGWVPLYFLGKNAHDSAGNLWTTLALPVGMAIGALTAGLIADRWFPEHRARVVVLFLGLAAIGTLLLTVVPTGNPALAMMVLAAIGFLVYGPQASYWALCPELVGRDRAGTATGLMDASAYGIAALGQVLIGWAIDMSHTTAAAFFMIAVSCLLGAIIIIPVKK